MKIIQLSKGKTAKVDDDMYECLMQYKWYYHVKGYASGRHKGKTIWMHRIVNRTDEALFTDHIDGDKLNNQRSNLRTVTKQQNSMNKTTPSHNTTGYKGVSPSRGKFRAFIAVNGKNISLGRYDTPEEASRVYESASDEHFREYKRKTT